MIDMWPNNGKKEDAAAPTGNSSNGWQTTPAGQQLQARLTNEHTLIALTRLLDRIDELEQTVSTLATAVQQGPGLISMVTDTVDETYRTAAESGIDVENRLKGGLTILDKLTEPRTIDVLSGLLGRLDQVEQLVEMTDQAPGMISMVADTADEAYRQAAESGIDLEGRLKTGLTMANKLTAPKSVSLLDKLLNRANQVEKLVEIADQAPGMISMVADTADEAYRQAAESGIDLEERLKAGLTMANKLTAPKTVSLLDKLLDRADQVEQLIEMADQAPGMISMVADTADEAYRQAAESGIDLEGRLKAGLMMADKLTAPETVAVLEQLLSRIGQVGELIELADQAPGMISMVADTADEAYRQAAESGIDLEERLKSGLVIANQLLDRADQVEQLLEMADQAPGMISMVADTADEAYRQAAESGIDLEGRLKAGLTMADKLTAPETVAVLEQLLSRIGQVGELMQMVDQAPGMISMMADTLDETYRQAAQSGIDIEARLSASLAMTEKLTAPETMALLSALLDRTDKLAQAVQLIDEGPGFAAMAMDTFDEAYRQALSSGIDIDSLSGVLDPKMLKIVGNTGQALVRTQQQPIQPVGLFDLLKAIRDPNTQRAFSFLLAFGRNFGKSL